MYYQVLIEVSEKVGKNGNYKQHFELDKTDASEIEDDVVIPYLKGNKFQFNGYFIQAKEVKRIIVKESERTTAECSKEENDNMPSNVIMFVSREDVVSYDKHMKDITKNVFDSAQKKIDSGSLPNKTVAITKDVRTIDKSKVFIVHGHDDLAKTETARFIEQMGFESIILHEKASSGATIIEKIEQYSNVGFGVVLYTPCDVGAKDEKSHKLQKRARQNVVFEHGFLIGKLGRKNVCALVKGSMETPNDISGVVYVPMDEHGAWKIALAKELRNSDYEVDMNNVI